MNKKASGFLIGLVIFLVLLVLFLIGSIYYFMFFGTNYDKIYDERLVSGEIVNPAKGLLLEDSVKLFNEDFIYYLLVSIKAYNLHSSFGGDKPRIYIVVGDGTYNAIVDNGEIVVSKGLVEYEDILIGTTKEEVIKMMEDKEYVSQSFRDGNSWIEMIAGKTTLASKGYLDLYEEVTGESLI